MANARRPECASIHWIPLPKIVLAIHGSCPLRKLSWLLGAFQFERGGPDSDGSGAGKHPAIELEHFCSPLRLASVTLKPSKLIS